MSAASDRPLAHLTDEDVLRFLRDATVRSITSDERATWLRVAVSRGLIRLVLA